MLRNSCCWEWRAGIATPPAPLAGHRSPQSQHRTFLRLGSRWLSSPPGRFRPQSKAFPAAGGAPGARRHPGSEEETPTSFCNFNVLQTSPKVTKVSGFMGRHRVRVGLGPWRQIFAVESGRTKPDTSPNFSPLGKEE